MTLASDYRDAARIAREQSKQAMIKGLQDRSNFWKRQAISFEMSADNSESIAQYESSRNEIVFLFLREAVTSDWPCGWLTGPAPWQGTVIIIHPFCGPLGWIVPRMKIPEWVPVYSGEEVEVDTEEMYNRIDRYLRANP